MNELIYDKSHGFVLMAIGGMDEFAWGFSEKIGGKKRENWKNEKVVRN